MRETKLQGSSRPKALYLATNFEDLCKLVNDDIIKGLKNILRLPGIAHRMLLEIHQLQNDQEKLFIIGKRYLNVMDHYYVQIHDKEFFDLRYGTEYHQVKEMIAEVEDELRARYNSLATYMEEEFKHRDEKATPSSRSEASGFVYFKRTKEGSEKADSATSQARSIFSGEAVPPVSLFRAILTNKNILVVDARPTEEFAVSQINMQDGGKLINIPSDIIVPGLSANTLGQLLDEETQEIWNNRDTFDAIVLMDRDTDSINYPGSKLERLRNILVEWDFNRTYRDKPVLLNGGFKEFVEWYPSEVTNSLAYLSQTNSEMDELLTIDDVSYPEVGSASGNMNLKVHTVSSFGDVQARVTRDFGEDNKSPALPAKGSKSEGQLPKDFYVGSGLSAYKSLSEESLPKEFSTADTLEPIEKPKKDDGKGDDETGVVQKPTPADLLKKTRANAKPNLDSSPRADPKEVIIRNIVESHQDMFVKPEAPTIDRTFKPAIPAIQAIQGVPHFKVAEGYTGVKNVFNVCYMNSTLQSLKVIPVIKAMFVTSNNYLTHIHKRPPVLTLHFAKMMRVLWEGTQRHPKVHNPQPFLDKVWELNKVYAKHRHEDTFEFFIFLFNHISEDCSFDLPRPKIMTEREKSWYSQLQGRSSFFIDLTYYQLKNTRVCWNCQKPSYVFDSDSTLMLPVPENREKGNLVYMLKEYLKENLVPEYSCSECKSIATIVNRKEIVLDPEILIIVLKRYAVGPDGELRKNNVDISFPLDNLKFGNSSYKLYAVPQHHGSMESGHYYTTVLLDEKKDHWATCNDETITRHMTPINELPDIKSACVGFYYVRQGDKMMVP